MLMFIKNFIDKMGFLYENYMRHILFHLGKTAAPPGGVHLIKISIRKVILLL